MLVENRVWFDVYEKLGPIRSLFKKCLGFEIRS